MTFEYKGRNRLENLTGYADRAIARAFGKGKQEDDLIDPIPFDEEAAAQQGEDRRFHSNAPTGADYSAEYLNQVRRDALRALSDPNANYTDEEIKQLQQIAATGEVEDVDTEGFWTGLLNAIDIPGRLVRLALADAFQWDKNQGVEIEGDAYLQVLKFWDNPSDLADILGEDFVGEDGRFGGSKLLEAAGWEPYDEDEGVSTRLWGLSVPWSRRQFGRFLADFAVEVALDPFSYPTFGLGGLSKKFAVEATTAAVKKAMTKAGGGAIDEVIERMAKGIPFENASRVARQAVGDEVPEFVARLEDEMLESAREIFQKKVEEIGGIEEFNKLDAHTNFRIKEEVVEEAYHEVGKANLNKIAKSVVEKRFDELPEDFVSFVRNDPKLDSRILGGARIRIPQIIGGGGGPNPVGRVLPGGARKAREKLAQLPGLRKVFDSRIARATKEKWDDIAKKFASEQADIVAARNGELWQHTEAVRRMEARLTKSGIAHITPNLHAAATSLERLARQAGEDADEVTRKLLDYMEGGITGKSRIFADDDLNEAAMEFVTEAQKSMAVVHSALKELDEGLGHIQGYVPRLTSQRGRKMLEYLAEKITDPRSINGSTRGHEMLRAMLADQQRNAALRGGKALGEATHTRNRELFGTAVVMLDDVGHAMLSPDIARGYASIGELNEDLGRAIRDVVEQENLPIKVADDFKVWEDNPQKLLSSYFEGMEQALRERALLHEWENVGLIRRETRETDMWRTVDKIAGEINTKLRRQIVDRYEQLRETAERAGRILEGQDDLPRKTVNLGEGVTIELPTQVIEMPRVQRAIGKAQEKLKQAAQFRNDIVKEQVAYYNQLLEQGVNEMLARRLSLSVPSEVHKIKAENWAAAVADVNDNLEYMVRLLHEDVATTKDYLADARQLALDRASRQRRAVKEANEELERQWRQQFLEEIGDPETVTAIRHTMGPADLQALADRADHYLATNVTALLDNMDLPPLVREALDDLNSMGGNEAVQFGLQFFADLSGGARATVNLFDRLGQFADHPLISEVLESRRFQQIYKRARKWLSDPSIRSDERTQELWAEFMFSDPDDALTGAQKILESNKFLRASGAYMVADIIDDVSPAAARTLAEHDPQFRTMLDNALSTATKRDADTVAEDVLNDYLLQLGMAEAGIYKTVAEDFVESIASNLHRFDEIIPLIRRAAFDPALARTTRFQQGMVDLLDVLGFDTNLVAFSDEGVHLLAEVTEEVADFPTLSEIVDAVRKAGGETLAELTAEQRAKLPERIKRALDTEGVPEHVRTHEEISQWFAAAKRNSTQGGTIRRQMNKVNAAERVWNEDVLPALRKVLSGKTKIDTLRKKLYIRDANTGRLELMDLGKTLKAGLPDPMWDRIKNTLDYLEVAARPNAPKALLSANKKLLDGTAFKPFSQSYERLQNLANDIAMELTERERREAEASLSMLDEFQRLLEERIFPRGSMIHEGGARPTLPTNLFGDEEFKANVQAARKLAKKLGFDADLTLEKTTTKQAGFSPLSSAGVAGEITADRVGTETVRIVMNNMIESYRALHTPDGLESFGEGMRKVISFWKGMVTVTRPTFHLRNLIGGMFNNSIADVRLSDYAFVARHAPGFLRDLRKGRGLKAALERLPNDNVREVFEAMVESRVLENSFARREFGQIGSRGSTVFRRLSPISGDPNDFFLVAGGALAMESIEGFMRAAAFARHYHLGDRASARVARAVVNAVHFDYSDLSQAERWVKSVSPFFVWTRRNIPLQLRTLIERPGIMARYETLMGTIEDHAGELPQDQFPVSPYLSPGAAKTGITFGADTPFWARVILDPDLPVTDLMAIDPLSPGSWYEFIRSTLGPQVTLWADLGEQAEFGDVNAPAGLAEILKPFVSETQDGDVRIPYWQRTLFENVFPFYREIVGAIAPRDPRRAQRLGIDRSDGISLEERLQGILMRLASAGGASLQTPADAPSAAFQSQETIRSIQDTARLEGRIIQPEEDEGGFDVDAFLRSLGG